jgi:adenine-specific DNA-methyltransferase
MTKAELKSQFQNSYKRESWMPILKLVFGQINYFTDPFSLFEGEEAVKQGCQIGYVDLPNNQTVAIFEIEVADRIIIERNRKGLRDIAAKYIKATFSAALVFYYSKNQNEYRFSFIAQQSKIDEQTGVFNTVVTAPKRYTYVLGTPFCATAAERWIKLAAEPEINVDKITDAFSVEKLSIDFFNQYKIQYTRFCKFIEDDSVTLKQFIDHTETDTVKAQKPLRDYVKKLLGRLVFLQFLQKKGWMGVPATNKDWKGGDFNFMANLFNKSTNQDNFLDQVLEPLFFETLNSERTNDIAIKVDNTIKIPYLNGGLFDPTTLDATDVQFPKHYFSELFEFFNQYNFTIDENDPDDAEVGIDPEMLGHIFENLLEDNKDKGAFYTPKEIVRYMCQESLIAYLLTHTAVELHQPIERLIRTHIVDVCLQDKPNATLIQKLLVAVKICDPAIGSGAFPMGMLYEIFMVRRHLFSFLGKNESFSACLVKKEIIQNNIYGVDIEQGAVDIARLRFWLALVVDEDVPQALPNLDYKIVCGNSLISRFSLDAPIKDVFAEYNKKYKTNFTLQDYKNIVDAYTDTHEAKEQFRAKIEEIKGAFKSILLSSDLVTRKKIEAEVLDYELVGVFGERKGDTDKKGYKAAKTKLEKYLKSENDKINNKNYLNSFEWRFEFPSLLDENGNFMGFDIVIANPPYIGEKGNESIFQLVSNTSLGKRFYTRWMDYFYFFFHIGIDYLKDNGCLMVISTNYYFTSTGGNLLRKDINERTSITSLINFNELTIFESAVGQHNVITKLLKCKNDKLISYNFDVSKKGIADSTILKSILNKIDNETQYYEVDQESIFEGLDYQIRLQGKGQIDNISCSVNDVLRKMTINSTPLGSITSITMGIVSLSDTLSDSHLRKYKIEGEKGDGIYVLNHNELANLNLTAEEKDIYIKPFYKNSDIQKFISKKTNDLWLIYSKDKGKPIILPIGIKNHFEK